MAVSCVREGGGGKSQVGRFRGWSLRLKKCGGHARPAPRLHWPPWVTPVAVGSERVCVVARGGRGGGLCQRPGCSSSCFVRCKGSATKKARGDGLRPPAMARATPAPSSPRLCTVRWAWVCAWRCRGKVLWLCLSGSFGRLPPLACSRKASGWASAFVRPKTHGAPGHTPCPPHEAIQATHERRPTVERGGVAHGTCAKASTYSKEGLARFGIRGSPARPPPSSLLSPLPPSSLTCLLPRGHRVTSLQAHSTRQDARFPLVL